MNGQATSRQRLTKPNYLRKRREFLRVQKTGRRFKRRHLVLIVAPGDSAEARVGFTVSRKVGEAVMRNKVRRRLREILRLHPEAILPGRDHVVVAYSEAAGASYGTLRDELLWALNQARS